MHIVGYKLKIKQAVGQCSDNWAWTEIFKIYQKDKKGNVVFSGFIYHGELEYTIHNESDDCKRHLMDKNFN